MALGWCAGPGVPQRRCSRRSPPDRPGPGAGRQRGRVGGILAIAQTVGVVGGTGIASATGSIAAGYLTTAGVLVLPTLPYCLDSRDIRLPPRPARAVRRAPLPARSFWVSPREHPDFAWAWITRFLVNLGNAVGLLYLLYYMQDVVGCPPTRPRTGCSC